MTLLYADTSAIVRAYFADEQEHSALRAMLLEGRHPVVTSEVARLELASAVRAASRMGRLTAWEGLLARIEEDCSGEGPITLLALRPTVVLDTARHLLLEHRLRTLDALHLAVAVRECPGLADDGRVLFVTRDARQGAAAAAIGLATG